jgi:hypothetical protein
MMKTLIVISMMLIASVAYSKDAPAPVDADCNKMAMNAKSFAQLKLTGVATTPEQFASFIVSPTVQTYPIRSILGYVFESNDKSPDQIYAALYGRCTQMGYKDLLEYFTEREAYIDLKAKNVELLAKLVSSEHDKVILASQINQLKELMLTTAVKRHTNPNYVVDTTALKVSGK